MFDVGWGELLVIGALAIILIGPKRLPEVAHRAGKIWRDLRKAFDDATGDIRQELSSAREEIGRAKEQARTGLAAPPPAQPPAASKPAAGPLPAAPEEVHADPDLAGFIGEVTNPGERRG